VHTDAVEFGRCYPIFFVTSCIFTRSIFWLVGLGNPRIAYPWKCVCVYMKEWLPNDIFGPPRCRSVSYGIRSSTTKHQHHPSTHHCDHTYARNEEDFCNVGCQHKCSYLSLVYLVHISTIDLDDFVNAIGTIQHHERFLYVLCTIACFLTTTTEIGGGPNNPLSNPIFADEPSRSYAIWWSDRTVLHLHNCSPAGDIPVLMIIRRGTTTTTGFVLFQWLYIYL
jgi:hypothetical protein